MAVIRAEILASRIRFQRDVVPLFQDTKLAGDWEPIEGGEAASFLDTDHGCDWMLRPQGGRRLLVSTRTQLEGNHRNFTIRYALHTGRATEYDKLLSNDGAIKPGWYIQSHAFEDETVIEAAATRTDVLTTMLRRGQFYPPKGMSVEGGNKMVWIEWAWIERDGYEVIRREGPGAVRLRSYWAKRQGTLL